eukprot:SAG31_NODE_6321_length_2066_cov_7.228266_1_plen_185_part_00
MSAQEAAESRTAARSPHSLGHRGAIAPSAVSPASSLRRPHRRGRRVGGAGSRSGQRGPRGARQVACCWAVACWASVVCALSGHEFTVRARTMLVGTLAAGGARTPDTAVLRNAMVSSLHPRAYRVHVRRYRAAEMLRSANISIRKCSFLESRLNLNLGFQMDLDYRFDTVYGYSSTVQYSYSKY